MKDILAPNDSYNKRQIGQIVFDLFPDTGYHLFDFMSDYGVYMTSQCSEHISGASLSYCLVSLM